MQKNKSKAEISKIAAQLGSLGGSVSSVAKTKANREKIRAYWDKKKNKKSVDIQSA